MTRTSSSDPTTRAHGIAAGLWAPALTPLDGEGRPDHGRFVAHVGWLLEQGCHGVVAFGTTGEAPSFSVTERRAIVDVLLDWGVPPEQVIVGTGCSALPDSAELTLHAVDREVRGVLVLPPFYFKELGDEGLFRSYAELIDRVADERLRIYLYHFPRLSAVPITHAVIGRLLEEYPGLVVGLKDSSGDAASVTGFISAFPDLAVFPGTESIMLPMLERGAAGCITASANVNPASIRGVYDSFTAGQGATELQEAISLVRRALETVPTIPGLKSVVAAGRGDIGWRSVRPPLVALTDEESAALAAALADSGFAPAF